VILAELFLSFLQIGLFSVGGGYAAIPLIQSQTVDLHGWLTQAEFMDLATIAEMTPGPIAINGATFVGLKMAGLPGALAATAGNILPSILIVSLLAVLYRRYRELPALQKVLSVLRAAVVALIAAAGLNMLLQIGFGGRNRIAFENLNVFGLLLFAAAFFVLRKFKWKPILVMLLCGALGLLAGLVGIA
jgi:chromate transporter